MFEDFFSIFMATRRSFPRTSKTEITGSLDYLVWVTSKVTPGTVKKSNERKLEFIKDGFILEISAED